MSEQPGYQNIIVERRGAVGIVTLNRPAALNALNAALIGELAAALEELEEDAAIGAIVLTGNEKAFAAGADVKEMVAKSYPEIYCEDFITRGWERVAQCRKPSRRDPRTEQCLANIDVSEPGDDSLIEQRGFDRRHLAGERRGEIGAPEFGFERLRAQPCQERVLLLLAPLDIVEQPETAGIVEANDGTVVEPQHHMIVWCVRQPCDTCRDPPGHAEMEQQKSVRIELDQDVLSAPAERTDTGAIEP